MKKHTKFTRTEQGKKMELTKSQERARDAKEGNYLVSASAGSGKTAVLTERVFKVIVEGTKLDELLILTFTNLAATEMRDRVREKLLNENDPELFKIASSLDAAHIETYDAFALNLVKKYAYAINLSKDISLVDQNLLELEERKILNKIFEEHFDNRDEALLTLISDYCLKNSDDLKEFILSVSHKFDLKEDKETYLNSYINLYFNEERVKKDIDEYIKDTCKKIDDFIPRVKRFENAEYANLVVEILERLSNANTYDKLKEELSKEENKLPAARGALALTDYPDDKNYKDYLKKQLDKIADSLKLPTEKEVIEQYLGTKDNVETIIDIVKELDIRINSFKKKYNVYSFSDIFKFALRIVSIPEINEELKNKFKYIMIDEYQDTSDIQEKFINKIANNNVYVVGDVKQSIYRFRNANCDLFLDKFNRYGKGDGGTRIELPDNFRSRKEVVGLVNDIFSPLMDIKSTGLDYKNEHEMIYGNKTYISGESDYAPEILEYTLGDDYLIAEHEARLIASDIDKKIREGYEVFDKNTKSLRKASYSDFAIIMYAKKDFGLYQKVFNEYQIPLFANYDKSIRDNNLTMTFENIISLVYLYSQNDFSKKFLHSFVSLMRSFLFEYSDDKVEDVIYSKQYDKYELYSLIQKTSSETKDLNLKETIERIIANFDIYSKLIKIGDISNNISLLEYYYSIASQMDAMGYTLEDFKKYFDELKEFEIDPEYSPSDDVTNCVKLLSIHASKGLQFKICYFAQLYKRFNTRSFTEKCLVDSIYGIDVPNVHNKEITSFYHNLINKKEQKESLLEQLRVFYVALTRVEEKAIILYNVDYRKNPVQEFSQCSHFLDFVSYSNAPIKRKEGIIEKVEKKLKPPKDEIPLVTINESVKLSNEVVERTHASKQLDEEIDNNLLLLGNKYHYYLELLDFKTLDTSFIKDEKDKKRLDRFLSNPLFKDLGSANIMHEYPFYDEEANVNGVIDLLIEHDDHIDIVDFKLSHVDDEAYDKQLNTYKNYISKLTDKKINTYVTGILSGDIRKIN